MQNPVFKNDNHTNYLVSLIKGSFKKGYAYIKKFCREVVRLNPSTVAHSYCKFVKNHVDMIPEESLEYDTWKKSIEKLCVFSYVWSLGALLSE